MSKIKATVMVMKSFDDERRKFVKEFHEGDFKEFFEEEGEYLDKLSDITNERGEAGDGFTIVYTVIVEKEN